ncbi:hypothetical protein BDU57DRAFT_534219 [Ampelomyces quisqualis]|uniref:Uncharacterized protein n=1 Tax=Ampelomyces quisqualis TaxID=50730 RepID=A0A6A5QYF8_AMPQU|nr:hypothetical protein BDU57DRAFT_534219 [Ampelomyces quisqualis]
MTTRWQRDVLRENLERASALAPEYQLKLAALEKQIRDESHGDPVMDEVYEILRRQLSVPDKCAKTMYLRLEKRRKKAEEGQEDAAAPTLAPPPPSIPVIPTAPLALQQASNSPSPLSAPSLLMGPTIATLKSPEGAKRHHDFDEPQTARKKKISWVACIGD